MSRKIDSYITFSYLSKKIAFGDSMLPKLARKTIYLVVLASDIGETQKKRFLDKSSYYGVPVIFYENKDYLGNILHKSSISALGIENKNLASAIIKTKEGDDYGEEKTK